MVSMMEEREATRSVSLLIGGSVVGWLSHRWRWRRLRLQRRRLMGGGGEIRSGGIRSFGQTKSFGGGSVAMLANGGQFAWSKPSGPAGEVRAASEVSAAR